jgi:hypothetical protein
MSSQQPTHHGYAVNVKDPAVYIFGPLPEEDAQAIYERYREDFWADATAIARRHGFEGVWSEGRMGGWAVPHPQPHPEEDDQEVFTWVQQSFRPYELALMDLMDDYRADVRAALEEAAQRAEAEPAEAAYWAARDTITVDA